MTERLPSGSDRLDSVLGWLPHLGIEGHEEPQSRPRQAFEPEGIGGSGS